MLIIGEDSNLVMKMLYVTWQIHLQGQKETFPPPRYITAQFLFLQLYRDLTDM